MSHSIIIQISKNPLTKEDWGINDEADPSEIHYCCDYYGREFDDEDREKVLAEVESKYFKIANGKLIIGDKDVFIKDYTTKIINIAKAIQEHKDCLSHLRIDVYDGGEEIVFYESDYGYYTRVPSLIENYSNEEFYIGGVYDYHS